MIDCSGIDGMETLMFPQLQRPSAIFDDEDWGGGIQVWCFID
jgi:hypothetical protein